MSTRWQHLHLAYVAIWDKAEELQRQQEEEKERRDRYGCLKDQMSLFPELL
jgi:hypothetical protein